MTRLFARQVAVNVQELTDEMAAAVSGGGYYKPSYGGTDVEIAGVMLEYVHEEPGRTTGSFTCGINENT